MYTNRKDISHRKRRLELQQILEQETGPHTYPFNNSPPGFRYYCSCIRVQLCVNFKHGNPKHCSYTRVTLVSGSLVCGSTTLLKYSTEHGNSQNCSCIRVALISGSLISGFDCIGLCVSHCVCVFSLYFNQLQPKLLSFKLLFTTKT